MDVEYVTRLLEEHDLPVEDLDTAIDHVRIGVAADRRIGVGGVVPYDGEGLLRSVVVAPEHREEGYGAALVEALEAEACERGVDRVYLLTTTAAGFFAGLGYTEIPRDDAPPAVRESREFTTLCPASATCMRTSLDE